MDKKTAKPGIVKWWSIFTVPVFLLAVFSGPMPTTGEESLSPSPDTEDARISSGPALADLVTAALRANPTIEAARQGWKAEVERFRVETAYPDPELSARYLTDMVDTRSDPRNVEYTLTQGIPFPGKLGKAGDLVEADIRLARLAYERAARDVSTQVRESFFELGYIREARRIAGENLLLLAQLANLATTAYAAGGANAVDTSKALSQAGQVRYDILILEELEETERSRLNALLSRPPDTRIGPLVPEPIHPVNADFAALAKIAEANRQEIREAEAMTGKADASYDLAVLGNLPDFSIGLYAVDSGNPRLDNPADRDGDGFGIVAGMSLPIWVDKNLGRMARTQAERNQALAERRARVNDTMAELRSVFFRLRNAERLVTLYESDLLPQAARSVETAESWFRANQGSISDYVETRTVLYNFQLTAARARADHGRARARLERILGTSPDTPSPPPTPEKGETP